MPDTSVPWAIAIWVWRSLVACLNGVQEAGGSNPLTQTSGKLPLPISQLTSVGCDIFVARKEISIPKPFATIDAEDNALSAFFFLLLDTAPAFAALCGAYETRQSAAHGATGRRPMAAAMRNQPPKRDLGEKSRTQPGTPKMQRGVPRQTALAKTGAQWAKQDERSVRAGRKSPCAPGEGKEPQQHSALSQRGKSVYDRPVKHANAWARHLQRSGAKTR